MVLLPGNVALCIILGFSLQWVWSAVNVMQFLIYLQLWAITLPANTSKFIDYVAFIARGNFIPKAKIINFFFKLIGIKTNDTDNENSFTRFLLIIIIGVVVMAVLIAMLAFILNKYPKSRLKGYVVMMVHKLFWNTFLRMTIQIYLDFSVQAFMITAFF